jgi:hypothetical protein
VASKAAELKKLSRVGDERKAKEEYAEKLEQFFGSPDAWEQTARMTPAEFAVEVGTLDPRHRVPLLAKFNKLQGQVNRPPPETTIFQEAKKALGVGKKAKVADLAAEKKQQFADLYEGVRKLAVEFQIQNKGAKPGLQDIRTMVGQELEAVETTYEAPISCRAASPWTRSTVASALRDADAGRDVQRVRPRGDRERHLPEPTDDEVRRVLRRTSASCEGRSR